MRLGLFLILPQPPGTSQRQVFATALEDAAAAERLGFDSVWVTEHHGSAYGLSAAPSVVAAAIAARTARVAVGYAVNVTPLHAPVRLAEEIATVDQISGGRVIAGFGPGYSPVEFHTMGADFASRHRAHQDVIDTVVDRWLTGGGVRPLQVPHPPVAVTGATPEAASWAARRGYDLLTLGDEEHSARLRRAYRRDAQLGAAGARAGRFCLLRSICAVTPHTTADPPPVRDAIRWTLEHRNRMVAQPPPSEAQVDEYLRQRALIGPVDALRRGLRRLAAAGVDELLCWCRWGMLGDRTVRATMQALAGRAA
ncbi:MAG: LLM class flavin-dependent oxidoreductase [Spirochaetaceae bacterium]|nr:LLM class flavin-dependent oxidoreductase [Spirochaetaceae bacterium]MDE0447317.1 LLM class flavin-dependent oxidoreductase [Spirochaetaceae bacterium]